ncbi:MAG: electron transport complex subunit RsxG [Agitococcus sp.]|nr:electron transport complex subunit RsxG [Agitococcus sp.]
MNQAMRSSAITLSVFALIATGMVAGFHALTDQRILQSQQQSLTESLNALVLSSQYNNDLLHDTITIQDNDLLHLEQPETVYRARKNGLPVAVIFPVIAPDGYSGKIRLLVAINTNGELAGVRVLAHKETPGLGDAIDIDKSSWILDFNHKSLLSPSADGWYVKKDNGVFDQFTGATITPRAVVKAVHNALLYYQLHQQTLFSPVVAAHE